jgi:hypothetical protein
VRVIGRPSGPIPTTSDPGAAVAAVIVAAALLACTEPTAGARSEPSAVSTTVPVSKSGHSPAASPPAAVVLAEQSRLSTCGARPSPQRPVSSVSLAGNHAQSVFTGHCLPLRTAEIITRFVGVGSPPIPDRQSVSSAIASSGTRSVRVADDVTWGGREPVHVTFGKGAVDCEAGTVVVVSLVTYGGLEDLTAPDAITAGLDAVELRAVARSVIDNLRSTDAPTYRDLCRSSAGLRRPARRAWPFLPRRPCPTCAGRMPSCCRPRHPP